MAIQPLYDQIPLIVWWSHWDVYRNNTFVVSAFITLPPNLILLCRLYSALTACIRRLTQQ